jgi:N-acetylglucosamine-6-phosphate deacetylase
LLSTFPALDKYKGLVEPTIEFISDLQHLHPFVIQLILSSKSPGKLACVTDAVLEPGTTGNYTYAGFSLV